MIIYSGDALLIFKNYEMIQRYKLHERNRSSKIRDDKLIFACYNDIIIFDLINNCIFKILHEDDIITNVIMLNDCFITKCNTTR